MDNDVLQDEIDELKEELNQASGRIKELENLLEDIHIMTRSV